MDQASGRLVEESQHQQHQKSRRPLLTIVASSRSSSSGGGGKSQRAASTGSRGPAAASSGEADNSSPLIGSNSMSGDSLANNGRGSSAGNKQSQTASYSKLFLQYLPHTLNLNYNSKSGRLRRSAGQQSERQSSDREHRESGKQSVCDTRGHSSTRGSIASALSRLRLSAQGQQQATHSQSSRQVGNFREEAEEGEVLFISDSSRGGPNQRRGQKQQDPKTEARESFATKEAKIKRKGFLYLKRSSFAPTSGRGLQEESTTIDREAAEAGSAPGVESLGSKSREQTVDQTRLGGKQHKRRDLNNNSISSLLGSTCHQRRDAEHNQCLLDDDDDDSEEEEEERDEDERARGSTGSSNKTETSSFAEMSPSVVENNYRRVASHSAGSRKRKGARATASGDPRALILAGCLVFLGLGALFAGRLAAGQQQQQHSQQPVFSRSQPASQSASGAGGQSPASGGRAPSPQPAAGSLVANINCNKIKGHVTLTPNLQGGTTVSTQISAGPPGEVYQWSVHQFPVKPGAAMCSCSPMILGTKLIDLSEMHGNLPSDQEFNVQSSLNLFGSESPVGHSLLLRGMKTGMVACATFLPTSRKSNYRAKFHTPISGSVTIFQTAFGTSFIAHLMYSNGTRRHSMHRFDLVKSEDDMVTTSLLSGQQVGGSLQAGSSRAESLLAEQREHEHELSQCRRYATGEPLFRNMSYQLAVSTENFGMRGRTAMVLPQIPFETFASVFVIVYSEQDPGEPMACAPLKFVKPKTAAAKFQSVSVQGSVVFSQDSPYDATLARINLNLPNSDGHSYGIDELPMIIRRKSDTRVCPNIREIIYNPHHVEPSSVPAEGEATSDQYAVGDLSGKYGSLTGKSTEKIQAQDFNLPLYGPISIVGRAMTIYSAEGVAIACSNVELTTPMTTAFATFDYGIQGQFIFRQPVNDCNGDTYVYIEVSKPVAGPTGGATAVSGGAPPQQLEPARSLDHNWHIHTNPVDSGLEHLSTTDCAPAGAHFNPYNTSTGPIYSRDCTPFNVLRCELGDMSAKMFTIEIPPYRVKGGQEPDIGKFFGTDIDLPLCGPASIVNRSVVVHAQDFGHQRLACSTVIEFKPRAAS